MCGLFKDTVTITVNDDQQDATIWAFFIYS